MRDNVCSPTAFLSVCRMAKINATYGSGYYYPDDFDPRAMADQRRREQRLPARRGRDDGDGADEPAAAPHSVRQTAMLEFTLSCNHCGKVIGRGTKFYMNRTKTGEMYLNIEPIWELSFRCPKCTGEIAIRTDPENRKRTGGYVPHRNCHRVSAEYENSRDEPNVGAAAPSATEEDADGMDALQAKLEQHRQATLDGERVDAMVEQHMADVQSVTAQAMRAAVTSSHVDSLQPATARPHSRDLTPEEKAAAVAEYRAARGELVRRPPALSSLPVPATSLRALGASLFAPSASAARATPLQPRERPVPSQMTLQDVSSGSGHRPDVESQRSASREARSIPAAVPNIRQEDEAPAPVGGGASSALSQLLDFYQ